MPHDPMTAGQTPDANRIATLDTHGSYSPQLLATSSNPNLGADGDITGRWQRNGHHISGWVRVLFSGSGLAAGSGTYMITLPFDPDPGFHTFVDIVAAATHFGSGFIEDANNTSNRESVETYLREAPNRMGMRTASGTSITNSNPFTWADGDRISVHFAYVADPAGLP